MSSIIQQIRKINAENRDFEFFYNVESIKNQIKLGLTLRSQFILVSKKDSCIYRINKVLSMGEKMEISIDRLPVDTKQTAALAGNNEDEFIKRFSPDLVIEESIIEKRPRKLTFWQKLTWGL